MRTRVATALVAIALAAASGAAPAQGACRDLRDCLDSLARDTAEILHRGAQRAGGSPRMSFRRAFSEPRGVRIFCSALSGGLRNVLHELVQKDLSRFDLDFDLHLAERDRVEPPEATMVWKTRDGAETMAVDAHIALPEGRSRRLSAAVPVSALSEEERACLFDFHEREAWVETPRDRVVVLREYPTFRADDVVKELQPGEKLHVVGRIEAPGHEDEGWSVVAWTDDELPDRRNVFVKGLGPLVEAARADDEADDEAYADARRADTVSAYNAYLSERPSGRHAAKAQRRRNAAAARADDEAYADARRADTVSAYDAYLSERPSGRNAAEAQQLRDAAAAREREPWREFRDCEECPRMVVVPAGEFEMGSPPSEEGRFDGEEEPVHPVRIGEPFAIGIHEVTRGEFARFVSAAGRETGNSCLSRDGEGFVERPGATWRNPGFEQTDDHPVVCVSWNDAVAYARWLSGETGHDYRLPSESEWEYAARAGTRAARWWGEDASSQCAHANGAAGETSVDWRYEGCEDEHVRTAPVGSFQANDWKLRDMLGNVWEWTRDCWNEDYAAAPSDGSAREAGDCRFRVFRGGSWMSEPRYLRAAIRGASAIRRANASEVRLDDAGFRVVRALAR